MSGDWQALSCMTAGHSFYRFRSHCGSFVSRSADCTFQFGCLPRGSDSGVQWFYSVREPVATPGFVETPSNDTGTDVEDKLECVSPLPTMISPIPDSDAAIPISPAGTITAGAGWLSYSTSGGKCATDT